MLEGSIYLLKVKKWTCESLSCARLCGLCSLPGSSVHGILQAGILDWVARPSSRGCSWPRGPTLVSCIIGRLFTVWATREAHLSSNTWKMVVYLSSHDNHFWSGICLPLPQLQFLPARGSEKGHGNQRWGKMLSYYHWLLTGAAFLLPSPLPSLLPFFFPSSPSFSLPSLAPFFPYYGHQIKADCTRLNKTWSCPYKKPMIWLWAKYRGSHRKELSILLRRSRKA